MLEVGGDHSGIGGAAAMHGTLHGIGRQNLGRGGVDLGGKQVTFGNDEAVGV